MEAGEICHANLLNGTEGMHKCGIKGMTRGKEGEREWR